MTQEPGAGTTGTTGTVATTPPATFRDLCIDADDPQLVGGFWARVLGRELAAAGQGVGTSRDAVLRPGDDGGPTIWVNGVPEKRTEKVRLHVDVDLREGAGVEDLVALGAVVRHAPRELDASQGWWVLEDPEGHAFCAFPPGT